MSLKAILSILTFVICLSLSSAPSLEEFDAFIENARIQKKIPGVAVVIVEGNQVIFAKGYGLCHLDRSEKIDENTIFQLGSISKTFASAALGVQVDRRKLKWDDEIIRFLPQFALQEPYSTRYTTSRDLLAHRTGLPPFGGDLLGRMGYSSDEILYRVRFIKPASSFRDKAFYSNVGFFVAGELLAKLANSSCEDAIKKTLMRPLKMNRSGFSSNLDLQNVAYPHAEIDGTIQVVPWETSKAFPAAGGVTSTARDMANWMIMQINEGTFEGKHILKAETVKQMHLPSMVGEVSFTETFPITETSSFAYGLGWNNYQYRGKFIVEKGGGLDGVRTLVTLIPDLKLGIAIFANLNLTFLPELLRAKFLEMYLGSDSDDFEQQIDEKEQKLADMIKLQKAENPLPMAHNLEQYVGKFENELYGIFAISIRDEQLSLKAGTWTGSLTHWSNDTFILQWPSINAGHQLVTFTFGPDGNAVEMETETLGTFHLAE